VGWWPGPIYGGGFYRPFWSPAYVSFLGWGGGWGFGVGFGGWGGFGWFPIGPCDRFYPWWGGYRGHFAAVGFRGNFGRYVASDRCMVANRYSNVARIHDTTSALGFDARANRSATDTPVRARPPGRNLTCHA